MNPNRRTFLGIAAGAGAMSLVGGNASFGADSDDELEATAARPVLDMSPH
jgi:hypothetical protein